MTHQKELKALPHEASSLSTTRSPFLVMSTKQSSSTPLKHPLSPERIHAITILLGHPLTSEPGQCIQKWILYQEIINYTDFLIQWDPIQLEDSRNLQEYADTDGFIAHL